MTTVRWVDYNNCIKLSNQLAGANLSIIHKCLNSHYKRLISLVYNFLSVIQ